MSDPYIGEIKVIAFNYPPRGWAFCNGQLLPINQNQALFSILGTMYGGNGQTNFALPNLRGRIPIHMGGSPSAHNLGEAAGSTAVTVNIQQLPTHMHALMVSKSNGTLNNPTGNFLAGVNNGYHSPTNLVTMNSGSVTSVGGSQPHNNMMPYLVLNFIIALQGIFPSRN